MSRKAVLTAIKDYYLSGETVTLTPAQEAVRDRMSFAYATLGKYKSITQVKDLLVREKGVSEAQAYRDINASINLFGDILKSSKEGHRYIVYEYAQKAFRIALDKEDVKGMNAAVANMTKLMGLDKIDPDMPDFGKLKQSVYALVLAPESQKQIDGLISTAQGSLDLSTLIKPSISDAEILEENDSRAEE